MKSILNYAFIMALLLAGTTIFGQKTTVKDTITVKGTCNMCKERIENAALLPGVKLAEWNKATDVLLIIYRSDKVSLDEIHQSIANAGHDTNKLNATKEDYEKLPQCCAYRGTGQKH